MYTDSLKHKPMTDSPWLAIYDNHGFDPCRADPTLEVEDNHLQWLRMTYKSGGGGTHIFGRTGMCRPDESLFYKKSLNI